MSLRLRDAFVSVLLGMLAVLAWPVTPWSTVGLYDIALTATGAKNERALSAEVWVHGLPAGLDASSLAATASTSNGWELREGSVVSYQAQPSTMRFKGELPGDGAFVFGRHGWSGHLTLEVNGVTRSEDLYAEGADRPALSIPLRVFPAASRTVWDQWDRFLRLVLLWSAAIFAMFTALRSLKPAKRGPPAGSYGRDTARYALPAIGIFSLVLLATWPAQMSPDSVGQWAELVNGSFTNAHPVIHTLMIGGPGYLLGSPGWSMALQIVLLALACGALAAEVRRWGVSDVGTWLVAILVPALPGVHLLSTVFWKDVPYAAAIAGLTAMLMALIRTRGEAAERAAFTAGFGALLLLTATLRHNGVLVSAGTVALLSMLMWRRLKPRFLLAAATASFVLPLIWTAAIVPALGIAGLGRHYGGAVPMHLLGRMVAENHISDADTIRRLDAILPLEGWTSNYDCLSIVPLFWAEGINYDKIDETLFGPALRAAVEQPWAALAHLLCVNSAVWRLSPTEGAIHSLVPLGIWKASPPLASHNPVEAPMSASLKQAVNEEFRLTTDGALFIVFWRPAFAFLVLGAALAFASRRGCAFTGLLALACAPVLLNTLSMIPLMGSQDFRYHLPVYVAGPFLACAMISLGRRLAMVAEERG